MSSASNVSGRRFRSNLYLFALLAAGLLSPIDVSAQMFSVKPPRDYIQLPRMAIYAGFDQTEVTYREGSVPLPYTDFSFNAPLFRLQVETAGLSLGYSTGKGLGSANTDYSSFQVALISGLPILRRKEVQLTLPVNVFSVYTLMTSRIAQVTNADFRQNALGVGTGLDAQIRLSPRTRLALAATGGYSFSANGFNSNGGRVLQYDASARFYVDGLVKNVGLTGGVLYHQRTYELDVSAYNYQITAPSAVLGITF